MKIPNCPKCGSPMQIELLGAYRQYGCSSNSLYKKEYCSGSIDIGPKKILSMTEISENLASDTYVQSDERVKEQTNLKRTDSGIQQCEDRYKRFLSEKELKTLHAAQEIVRKFHKAVEQSKHVAADAEKKKRREEEEAYRQECIEKADRFLAGLNQDEMLLKCETFTEYSKSRALHNSFFSYKKVPTKEKLNVFKIKMGKEIDSSSFYRDPDERKDYETFEKNYLKNRDISKRRDAFRVVKLNGDKCEKRP